MPFTPKRLMCWWQPVQNHLFCLSPERYIKEISSNCSTLCTKNEASEKQIWFCLFFIIQGIRLCAHLTSHIRSCLSIFLCRSGDAVLESMHLCPWSAGILSPGLESSSGAFCLQRLLPQSAYQQLFHESGSVLQNKSVSLLRFYTQGGEVI